MNNAQMSARVGLFFLLGIALTWVTLDSLSDTKIDRKKGYTLTAQFKNLKELKKGDEVRMAGVKVGEVSATRLNGRRAVAELLIDSKAQIAKDATATIAMAGLLGSNYVSLTLGSEGVDFLPPGGELRTVDTPDLNTMIAQLGDIGEKVDAALGQFSGAMGGRNGEGILGKLDMIVEENRSKVGEITTNLQEITDKVNKGEGTLGRLVNDPDAYNRLLAAVDEIKGAATETKTFVSGAQGLIEQVKSGQGTLGVLLYDQEAGNNIKVVAKNLRDLSDKINSGEGTLGKLINDDSLLRDAQSTLRKVDRAVDGMADQGPMTAVGVAANALF